MNIDTDLDIVLIWVDGNDPDWQYEYKKHSSKYINGDTSEIRFRDFELLKYWFRGIEKYMPWVRKIHFVTCGHYPNWLDINNKKINFVKHSDFIPKEYLPTFNSHTIELNLHRIKGLSENFIYFNDDFFIINKINSDYFFNLKTKLPKDCLIFNPIIPGGISHIVMNNLEIIKKYHTKNSITKKHWKKILNLKYGKNLLRTLFLMPWPELIGFKDTHLPAAFKKETYIELWNLEYDALHTTCKSKFRENNNISQYLIRYWQLANGFFEATDVTKKSEYLDLGRDNINHICNLIESQNKSILIINDANVENFESVKIKLINSFNKILPEKSNFENDVNKNA